MTGLPRSTIYVITAAGLFFLLSLVAVWALSQKSLHSQVTENASSVDSEIAKLNNEIRVHPKNIKTYLAASNAYVQKIRETADASYYATIDELLNTATGIDAQNPDIYALKASVANGRHHFKEGLDLIQRALLLKSNVASYYGIKADSEIELGKYDDAEKSLQSMVDMKPNYSAYTRISYLRELTGDIAGAEEALQMAISAGSTFTENVAWAYVELGMLQMRTDLLAAERSFTIALQIQADYAPALEGIGKIAFARGDVKSAYTSFNKAFALHALAQYATDLGDVYSTQGDVSNATREYALADIAYRKSAVSGLDSDLEYSLFLSDHGDATQALEKAERAHTHRPSIYGADAYAWALYKNNRSKEAMQFVHEALRFGENDASIVFHAGMIAKANGEVVQAKKYFKKVQALNPHFSIFYVATRMKESN